MGSKILIIGFEKENEIMYPHLQGFINCLSNHYIVTYKYFYERGYFVKEADIHCLLEDFRNIFSEFKATFSHIIAIDNLVYGLASKIFDNVILWSHDFVTNDQEHFYTKIQTDIRLLTSNSVINNKKIIIQDRDRFNLFVESHNLQHIKLDTFYLPVSLQPSPCNSYDNNLNMKNPKVLQIGGINQFRSASKDLITHFKDNYNSYTLCLHGFIDNNIQQFIDTLEIKPLTTNNILNSIEVYKMVQGCDIGIICYNVTNKNFYLTAFASGQLVEFIKCSKPVIIFGNTNLKNYVLDNNIGIGIDSLDELNDAITRIIKNYDVLSKNALSLFYKCYNINIYKDQLIEWINK